MIHNDKPFIYSARLSLADVPPHILWFNKLEHAVLVLHQDIFNAQSLNGRYRAGLEKQWLRFKVIVDVADNGEGKKKMLFSLKFLGETAAYMRAAENFKTLITEQLGADNTFIGTYANK